MKRIIFLLFFIAETVNLNAQEVKLYWIHDNDKQQIYDSDKNNYFEKEFVKKIKSAKKMSSLKAEKACVSEGEYELELDGTVYEFQNEYWIYNKNNNYFLRCNLLDISRELLIKFFIEERKK